MPEDKAAILYAIVIDKDHQKQRHGGELLKLCEKWLKTQSYKTLYVRPPESAYKFYKKDNYVEMKLNNHTDYLKDFHYIELGKIL